MPYASKRWDMLDESDTVLKTFNYYQTKAEIGFLETKIERDGETIVPRGHVVLKENDKIILGGEEHFDQTGQSLIESVIPAGHKWENKQIKDLKLPSNRLIIMIQRDTNDIIVPVGETKVLENDTVVLIEVEHSLAFPRVDEGA